MTELEGKVAWVSGAGSGMGKASALDLAGSGWRVIVSGRREDALCDTAALIADAGGEVAVLPLDVRSDGVAEVAERAVARWGRLDALVLAAGLNSPKRTWADHDLTDFEEVVSTNLTGVARVVTAALPALRHRRGVVVVVSSYSAWTYHPSAGVAYGASKSALATLVRTINSQESASGVRACHLCPGDVDTDFLRMRPVVPDAADRAVMLSPSDIAGAVRFVVEAPPHVRIDELVISPVSQI